MTLAPDFGHRLALAVGARLRLARQARGLTQQEVARAIASHRPIVARTEHGRHVPSLDVLARHGAAVGLSLRDLGETMDAVIAGRLVPAPPSNEERQVRARARQRMHHAAAPVLDAWASRRVG